MSGVRFKQWSPSVWVGAIMVAVFIVLGLFGPWLAPYPVGARAMDLDHMYAPMSWAHWLGTDKSGIDTLSQLLHGAREALILSVIVVAISASIGVTIGMVAGYARGVVDEVIMRVVDIFLAFRGSCSTSRSSRSWRGRACRSSSSRCAPTAGSATPGSPAARCSPCASATTSSRPGPLGASTPRILFHHIAPNLIAPLLVQMSLSFGNVIAAEASLSFLGLGPQIDHTWGAMLEQGTSFLWKPGFRHYALAAGFAIAWVVLAANLLGDGLRDRLDPRQRGRL
ncbi:MAG: ABC transporter permease [Myxococcales bacterium]|nr:ABC transporter permease [Myxococcales bacterium]